MAAFGEWVQHISHWKIGSQVLLSSTGPIVLPGHGSFGGQCLPFCHLSPFLFTKQSRLSEIQIMPESIITSVTIVAKKPTTIFVRGTLNVALM